MIIIDLSIKIQIAPYPLTTMPNKPIKNSNKISSYVANSFLHQGQKGIPKLVLWLGMVKRLSLPSCSFKYPSHKKVFENLSSTTLSTSCTKTSVSPSVLALAAIPAVYIAPILPGASGIHPVGASTMIKSHSTS